MAGRPQLALPEIPQVPILKRIARVRERFTELDRPELIELMAAFIEQHELSDEFIAYLIDELHERRGDDPDLEVVLRVRK